MIYLLAWRCVGICTSDGCNAFRIQEAGEILWQIPHLLCHRKIHVLVNHPLLGYIHPSMATQSPSLLRSASPFCSLCPGPPCIEHRIRVINYDTREQPKAQSVHRDAQELDP